jgi:methyl-accepting chemotaxis protein
MMVRDSLNLLLSETGSLTQAAFNGEFSYQPDLSLHKGEYANIMRSISDAMAYLIAPFRTCEEYMRKIGNGEIPEKITDEYKGEFNKIKNSINACIDGLGGLIEGRDILVRMSVNDYTEQVTGSYLGIYAEIAESINSVSNTVRN